MARSIIEIKQAIGDEFVSNPDIQNKYGLDGSKSFDELFPPVTIESILFYVVASTIWTFEIILDRFKKDVESMVARNFVANAAWWWKQMMRYQHGDKLIMNIQTFVFDYEYADVEKNIIGFCAVREKGINYGGISYDDGKDVYLIVAGKDNSNVVTISSDKQTAIQQYVDMIRPAGVRVSVILAKEVLFSISVTVFYDPLLLNSSGERVAEGGNPVSDSIQNFIFNLNTQNFGGGMNTTRLIDAIQKSDGVKDIVIHSITINGALVENMYQTFYLKDGFWKLDISTSAIAYQPQRLML